MDAKKKNKQYLLILCVFYIATLLFFLHDMPVLQHLFYLFVSQYIVKIERKKNVMLAYHYFFDMLLNDIKSGFPKPNTSLCNSFDDHIVKTIIHIYYFTSFY